MEPMLNAEITRHHLVLRHLAVSVAVMEKLKKVDNAVDNRRCCLFGTGDYLNIGTNSTVTVVNIGHKPMRQVHGCLRYAYSPPPAAEKCQADIRFPGRQDSSSSVPLPLYE